MLQGRNRESRFIISYFFYFRKFKLKLNINKTLVTILNYINFFNLCAVHFLSKF